MDNLCDVRGLHRPCEMRETVSKCEKCTGTNPGGPLESTNGWRLPVADSRYSGKAGGAVVCLCVRRAVPRTGRRLLLASWLSLGGLSTPPSPPFSGKTNPTSPLESTNGSQNEPKTNPNEPNFGGLGVGKLPQGPARSPATGRCLLAVYRKGPESRNEPEMSFRISKRLSGGNCRSPLYEIPAAHGQQLCPLASLRATCISTGSPAAASSLLAIAWWLENPPAPLFPAKRTQLLL